MIDARGAEIVTDNPTRLEMDYGVRTDSSPVYLGKAGPGVATTSPAWTITKFAYESNDDNARMTRFDVRQGVAWDNRTTPPQAWDF